MNYNDNKNDPDNQKRLIAAFIASVIFLSIYYLVFPPMKAVNQPTADKVVQTATTPSKAIEAEKPKAEIQSIDNALQSSRRISVLSDSMIGSISTRGGRIDDIKLGDYFETLKNKENVRLLSPAQTNAPYYVETGWLPPEGQSNSLSLPSSKTNWQVVSGSTLTPENPVTLRWSNGSGLTFQRTIEIDENYVWTVSESVSNSGDRGVTLYPYNIVSRTTAPVIKDDQAGPPGASAIMHEGPISYVKDELNEFSFDDVKEDGPIIIDDVKSGWSGVTDKYWLVAQLMPRGESSKDQLRLSHKDLGEERNLYQMDLLKERVIVGPGETKTTTHRFFTGAKRLNLLRDYEDELNIPHLDLSIDFGWFYIITKPLYLVLSALGHFFASLGAYAPFGLSILAVTVLMRLLTFPLANKAYTSMNKMKTLAPKMKEIKEKFSDDRERMQQEIMKLYKKEDVSPASGCLPMLVQIPIFFALYKVLYVSIEMRHAPFYGWINDLSAPDPSNVLFFLNYLPFDIPGFLTIGLLPVLYGLLFFFQQRLSPPPTDDVQKNVMVMLPFFFMYLFSRFPAGLVIYFVWSNFIGIVQQTVIRYKMGHKPKLYLRSSKSEEE